MYSHQRLFGISDTIVREHRLVRLDKNQIARRSETTTVTIPNLWQAQKIQASQTTQTIMGIVGNINRNK